MFYRLTFNPYNAELFVFKPSKSKGLFQFELLVNVFVSSFRLIRIPILSDYGSTAVVNILFLSIQCGNRLYTSESDVYRRQILMYKVSPNAEREKLRRS